MRDLFTNSSHTIDAGQASSGIAKEALTLRIVRGRAWVTVEGASHDYWLTAGNILQAAPGYLTVVEADSAHGELELRIERPQSCAALAAGLMATAYRHARRAMFRKDAQAAVQRQVIADCK
jgi:hypothetical protein